MGYEIHQPYSKRITKGEQKGFILEKPLPICTADRLCLMKTIPSLQAELKGIENWVEIKDDEGNEEWGYEYVPPNIPLVLAGELLHG